MKKELYPFKDFKSAASAAYDFAEEYGIDFNKVHLEYIRVFKWRKWRLRWRWRIDDWPQSITSA